MNNLKKGNPYKDDNGIVYSNEAKPGTVHTINGEEYYVAHPDLKWSIESRNFKDKNGEIDFDGAHIITSLVYDMSEMFAGAKTFNQDIGSWDTSNVENMEAMFSLAEDFNQDIGSWNTGDVINMSYMFESALCFNQDRSSWNVSSVTDMSYMFMVARNFNQDISNWDVDNVKDMTGMFAYNLEFNQNLSKREVDQVKHSSFFDEEVKNWKDRHKPKFV